MSSKGTKSILVSGWRFLPHSYAIVNQFQCLELLRRGDIDLFFEDRPFYSKGWHSVRGLMSADDELRLETLPLLPEGGMADAELRMSFPYDLTPSKGARRLFVFGTAEHRGVPNGYIAGGMPLADALAKDPEARIITPSEWSRRGFIASGADPERVSVVPHGVDPAMLRPPSADERKAARVIHSIADDEFTFLAVGAMTGSKNPSMTLKAFASVLREHPRALLVLKGMDALWHSYDMFKAALAEALPGMEMALVLPRVRYIGKSLTFDEVASLYHAADCYVTPYSAEGFNMPALEAAACGLPVIATAGGPTDEFLTDEFALRIRSEEVDVPVEGSMMTGLSPDPQHLAELMTRIVDDRSFQKQAAVIGPEYIRSSFTWKHAVDKLLAALFPDDYSKELG